MDSDALMMQHVVQCIPSVCVCVCMCVSMGMGRGKGS